MDQRKSVVLGVEGEEAIIKTPRVKGNPAVCFFFFNLYSTAERCTFEVPKSHFHIAHESESSLMFCQFLRSGWNNNCSGKYTLYERNHFGDMQTSITVVFKSSDKISVSGK